MNKSTGRPRAVDLEERHKNLMATAGRLFLTKGYAKVSLELIAREAHVAVRTIYVKFGSKAGLFYEVLIAHYERFIRPQQMDTDMRPFKVIIAEFGEQFLAMISTPETLEVQRLVIAEFKTSPDLTRQFNEAGPRKTRDMLARFFARPDIRLQLREELPMEIIPGYLINCVIGDIFSHFLFDPTAQTNEEVLSSLRKRLDLFYYTVLRQS
ncbi:MAG: TetR/AcrR family transcriptional regulator [Pseudomonadota bacterium]